MNWTSKGLVVVIMLALYKMFQFGNLQKEVKVIGHKEYDCYNSDVCIFGQVAYGILVAMVLVSFKYSIENVLIIYMFGILGGTYILNNPLFIRTSPFLCILILIFYKGNPKIHNID